MVTTIVLAHINTAPIAGLNIYAGYKMPGANGMASDDYDPDLSEFGCESFMPTILPIQ
jgi:hypothetical protein